MKTKSENMKEIISNVCNPVNESIMVQYFPILKYTGLDLESTLVLSYILGWNLSGNACFINKEKIANTFQISQSDVSEIISSMVDNEFIIIEEVPYKKSKSKGFHVNFEKILTDIITNSEYLKVKRVNELQDEMNKLKKGDNSSLASKNNINPDLEKLLKATRKK